MKTTLDLPDKILREAKKYAAQKGVSLKAVIEMALRNLLETKQRPLTFRLKKRTFRGEGLQPGVQEGNWGEWREKIYKGRGE